MSEFKPWFLAFLAVAGAFFIAGITGSTLTGIAGFWHLPGAGFAAALAVVVTTYIAAPSLKLQLSCLALAVGALAAWVILEPSSYPDTVHYHALAYQPTHLPFLSTISGGIVGLLLTALLKSRARA